MSRAETGARIATLVERGMTVSAPSEALAAALAEVGATMTAEWEAQAGAAGAAVLQAYRGN
jgi:TRAP-type C4-dicarboxylate transport system substrate-binding protein